MDRLHIEGTAETPMVNFNARTGQMVLKGRSIPGNSDEFWLPLTNWFEEFMLKPSDSVVFKLELEYFNITSSKRILFLLYKLNELSDAGKDVSVEWHYKKSDVDMYEVGQDYAYMVKVPFQFFPHEEFELVNV